MSLFDSRHQSCKGIVSDSTDNKGLQYPVLWYFQCRHRKSSHGSQPSQGVGVLLYRSQYCHGRTWVCLGPLLKADNASLENDLRAMRLLHSRVVDTAIVRPITKNTVYTHTQVFPHDRGKPYRRALRDL